MEEGRNDFIILTGTRIGKITLGRPRRRWEDNNRINLKEIGMQAGNLIHSAQNREYWNVPVNAALNFRVP